MNWPCRNSSLTPIKGQTRVRTLFHRQEQGKLKENERPPDHAKVPAGAASHLAKRHPLGFGYLPKPLKSEMRPWQVACRASLPLRGAARLF